LAIEQVRQNYLSTDTVKVSRGHLTEFHLLCAILVLVSGGVTQLVSEPIRLVEKLSGDETAWGARALFAPAYVYVAHVFFKYNKHFTSGIKRAAPLLMLTAICIASTFWSVSPVSTVLKSMLLLAFTLFAVSIVARFSSRDIIRAIAVSFVIIFIIGFLALVFAPSLAFHREFGSIRGLFLHKNIAGRTYVIGVIAGLAILTSNRKSLLVNITLALCVVGVFSSKSATAIISLAVIVTSYCFLLFCAKRRAVSVIATVYLIICVVILYYTNLFSEIYTLVLDVMGKDTTLSDRTYIWGKLIQAMFARDSLFGYGYEAFWTSPLGALNVFDARYFVPAHAHNGFVQTWVSLGFVGLVFLCGCIVRQAGRSIGSIYSGSVDQIFPALILIYTVFVNLSETTILQYSGYPWFVFVVAFCMSARAFSAPVAHYTSNRFGHQYA
jgi:exopolysaccharide production protein ExoQ